MVRTFISLALVMMCALPATGFAQNAASLVGTVTDESKGVLPGATITATEVSTGSTYAATTDERGQYRMPSILPGTYRLQAELAGFSTVVVPSVELLVGQAATMPFAMKLATVNETVTVTGLAPLVNTQSAAVGGNIDRRQMAELPILGRNWLEMSMLVKGITVNSTAGNRAGAARDDQFQLNVDGQQITQGISSSEAFGQPRISREAIAEYQLSTSGFDVTQGRSVGITVQAVTRSGTNDLHGNVYGNFRDDAMVAKDFVAQRVLPYSNQQTGFSIGGPIVENKLHYFGNYEYEREPNSTLINPQVYANSPTSTLTFPTKVTQHSMLARTDYQMSTNDRLSARGTYWKLDLPFGNFGGNQYPTAAAQSKRSNVSINGSWSRVLSDTLVQEIRAGFTRYEFGNLLGEGVPVTPIYRQSGFPDIGGTSFYPQEMWTSIPSVRYDLTWNANTHDIKIGGEYLHRNDGADWPNNTRGVFSISGESAASWARRFPLDAWSDPSRWDLTGLNVTRYNVSFARDYALEMPRQTWAAWIGDTWRITPRMTLNYGVRWDVDWGGLSVPGGIDTPVIINNGFDQNLDAGTYTGTRDLRDFAPRAGFTYQVRDDLVLRAGGGLFYAFQESGLLHGFQQQVTNERRFITIDLVNSTGRADFITNPLGNATPEQYINGSLPLPPVALRNVSKDYVNPRTFQGTVGFQKQVGQYFGFDADLLYNKGMHLGFDREVNLFQDPVSGFPRNPDFPTSGSVARPNPQYASIRYFESTLRSENLALATSFTRRLHHRWQAGGSYTFTFYSRDDGTNGFGYVAGGNNPFCQRCEWGTSAGYQRHTIRLNGIYEAPFGINVAAIYSFGSGSRTAMNYSNTVLSPVGVAGSLFAPFFPANRYVTGPTFTIPEKVVYPDGTERSVYDRLADGTPRSYSTGEQVARNGITGDIFSKLDVRLSKSVTIPGTSVKATGMFEVFNLLNHANYSVYNAFVNLPNFGRPTTGLQPRAAQLAFRVEF